MRRLQLAQAAHRRLNFFSPVLREWVHDAFVSAGLEVSSLWHTATEPLRIRGEISVKLSILARLIKLRQAIELA